MIPTLAKAREHLQRLSLDVSVEELEPFADAAERELKRTDARAPHDQRYWKHVEFRSKHPLDAAGLLARSYLDRRFGLDGYAAEVTEVLIGAHPSVGLLRYLNAPQGYAANAGMQA
jgi:hypothetical protein